MVSRKASSPNTQRRTSPSAMLLLVSVMTLSWPAVRAVTAGIGYEATTDVSSFLNLALDLQDMRLTDDIAEKRRIYSEGNQNQELTLQKLSFESEGRYERLTIYNVYRHAFEQLGIDSESDDLGYFDGKPEEIYADTIVDDLFRLNLSRIEADGALVMNMVMAFWGAIYSMLETCHKEPTNVNKMHRLLDEAAAYWVGGGQVKGDSTTGHSLYNLAETSGVKFGQDDGEVLVNKRMLETMAFIQVDIAGKKCELNGSTAYINMRKKVQVVQGLTNTVLVQMLLHHVQQAEMAGSSDFSELYSLSIYPQIAACDPGAADDLFDLTIAANVTTASRPQVVAAVQQAYSCLHIKCTDVGAYQSDKIPECMDNANAMDSMAGYVPKSDVRSKARIDRDISHITIDMKYEAYRSALLTYNLGWHTNFGLVSLATNEYTPLPNPIFDQFDAEFKKDLISSPAELINSILLNEKPFTGASGSQEAGFVEGLLRFVVMYVAALSELDSAIDLCEAEGDVNSMNMLWDGGAAFLIGSMEGKDAGGKEGGLLLYGLANDLCEDFQTCEPEDVSIVNGVILQGLKFGGQELAKGECQNARTAFEDTIRPNLLVPQFQGLLSYATDAEGNLDFTDLGFVESFATALIPTIRPLDAAAATKIANSASFEDGVALGPVSDGIGMLFNHVKDVLPKLDTDCTDIGRLTIDGTARGVCPDDPSFSRVVTNGTPAPVQAPTPVSPTTSTPAPVVVASSHPDGLAWGRYSFVARGIAENDALFSLDVRDMFFASSLTEARTIYEQGRNAPKGLSGPLGVLSLREFSTKASSFMKDDPMYNFYRYGLYEDNSFDSPNGSDGWAFGDTVISLALGPKNGESTHLAAEAAVVVNIWMMIAHRLHYSVRECADGTGSAAAAIDSAVGLWIGKDTAEGKFRSGYSMYSLGQSAHRLYGNDESEAPVNTRLMDLFVRAQTDAKSCDAAGSEALQESLYHTIEDIQNEMGKPVLQMLLYFASRDEANPTELYALSFLPRATSCDINAYSKLRDTFFEGYEIGTLTSEVILKDLSSVMHCFRYTCEDLGDVTKLSADHAQLVSIICSEMQENFDDTTLAGYKTTSDVAELARLDLDLHQMDLMMRVGSYKAANEIYTHGRNSRRSDGGRNSLKQLTQTSNAGPLYAVFETYFKSPTYAADQVGFALQPEVDNRFSGASRLQRAEFSFRSLQALVSYQAVSSNLAKAVLECKSGNDVAGLVDAAAALLVGSIEGSQSGGSSDGSGVMLMSLAKEQCGAFGKCMDHGDATSNEFILIALQEIKTSMTASDCDGASTFIEDQIEPRLITPMIQASLYYASVNVDLPAGDKSKTLASSDILSKAVLPSIDPLNKTSSTTILENLEFNLAQKPVIDGVDKVFAAFKSVIEDLKVECDMVGFLTAKSLTLCDAAPHPPSTPTNLGGDLYTSSTYVQDRADIALDVKEMEEELTGDQKVLATLVYEEGEHSSVYDSNGMKTGRRSLASFSVNADSTMLFNPLFQIAKFALSDSNGKYQGSGAGRFADTIVRDALANGGTSTLAAEAAVALNLWMELTNELFETVRKCENGGFADDDGIHSIDEAAAYWIGDGQVAGNEEEGHLLYRLAEEMGKHFNVIEGSGQSRTNTNILGLLHEAKLELSLPGACSADGATKSRLRTTVNKVTSQMLLVNAQALIHYLRTGDKKRVKVYAHGYVPFVVACSPTTFGFLSEKLLDISYSATEVESIIRAIQSTFQCFDISCSDVGLHTSESETTCEDPEPLRPMAGYRPSANVRQASTIDHDIAELDILMRMGALEAAEDLYIYGRHADTGLDSGRVVLSLHRLATSNTRTSVPEYDAFQRYFGSDDYADEIILRAFSPTNIMSREQRRSLVIGTAQYMIMLMAALEHMHLSIESCNAGATSDGGIAHTQWDTAAAFIIGDREGPNDGGSGEGKLLWALAKQKCSEFGTCSELVSGSARVNDRITSLLYSGRGAITGKNCEVLRKNVMELSDLLPVPVFQGALSSVEEVHNSKGSIRDEAHVRAHVFSQGLVPLVASHDEVSALIVAQNLDFDGAPLSSGFATVANALVTGIRAAGIDCAQVGASPRINGCSGVQGGDDEDSKLGIILGVLFGSLVAVGVVFLVRRKKRKSLETKPVFVESRGVMNHTDSVRPESAIPFESNGLDRISDDGSTHNIFPEASPDDDHSDNVV